MRRGTGALNYNTKTAIRIHYGLEAEQQKSYKFAVISDFFGALATNYLYPVGRAMKYATDATGRTIERGARATKNGFGRGLEGFGRVTEKRGRIMQGTNKKSLQNETPFGPNPTTGLYEAGGGRRKRKNKTNRVNKRKPRYYLKTLKKRKVKSKNKKG